MDVTVTEAQGLPPKAYLSVRVGETRRQAPFERAEPLHFPSGASSKHLVLDVFEKVGTTQVSLLGLHDQAREVNLEPLGIRKADGGVIRVGLKVALSDKKATEKTETKKRESRHKAAIGAKGYLDGHLVQDILQNMVYSLLAKQPEDPMAFMRDYLEAKRQEMPSTGGGAGAKVREKPWPTPGFSTEECPATMPSLEGRSTNLAQVLQESPSIYENLRSSRTVSGVTFAACVKPGFDDDKAIGAGVLAGDADCYEVFRDLFDPVLGVGRFGAGAEQPIGLDAFKVEDIKLDELSVVSVGVSLSRCFQGLRFPGAASDAEREEAERIAVQALTNQFGCLDGEYYPMPKSESYAAVLGGATEEDAKALRSAGMLPKEPETKFELSAGLGRAWPHARGVFASEDKSFSVTVNDKEHLKIQVSRKDPDLKAAFQLLCRAESSVRDSVRLEGTDFAYNQRLGFLMADPATVGTGLKASVVLKIPLLSSREWFVELCTRLGLAVEKASPSAGVGAWEVSNAARWGSSAADQVNAVLEGCNVLLDREACLRKDRTVPDLSLIPYSAARRLAPKTSTPGLGAGECPGFPADEAFFPMPDLSFHRSIVARLLRKDPTIYEKLRDKKTVKGVTFAKVIKPGLDCKDPPADKDKLLGLFAGDAESYETFADLFNPVIAYNLGLARTAPHQTNLDFFQLEGGDVDTTSQCVESVSVRTGRNLAGLRFSTACSFEERREAERAITQALSELTGTLEGEYFPLSGSSSVASVPGGMSAQEQQRLEGAGALFVSPDSDVLLSAGVGRDWPDSRGVFANIESPGVGFTARVNEMDHLTMQVVRPGSNLKEAFGQICNAEKIVSTALVQEGHAFAHSESFGFLTASPVGLGTNLTLSAKVKLPKSSSRPDFQKVCQDLKLQVRSLAGVGSQYEVIMAPSLGVSEVDQVTAFSDSLRKLCAAEKA